MGKGKQEIKEGDDSCLRCPVGDDLGGPVEEGGKGGDQDINGDPNQLRKDNGCDAAEDGSFFHTVVFLGAQVLAGKGSHGQGKAGNRQKAEAFDLGIGAASCHGSRAEGVDVGLHHHIGKGDDGILDPSRQTV